MAALHCSLQDCSKFLKSVLPMKLHHLQEIADHITASGNCSHPLHMLDESYHSRGPSSYTVAYPGG